MRDHAISIRLLRFARHQLLYVMVASGVAAIFWAITGQGPSLMVTLIYSFALGNLTALVLANVRLPGSWPKSSWFWLLYLIVLLVITPVVVTIVSAFVFIFIPPVLLPPAPRGSFWDFLLTAWKFPAVANLIFGGGYLFYKGTWDRLEDRNRQLQQTINSDNAERELDAAELQQGQDIQRGLLPKEIPQLANFEITGAWEPAKLVGGDCHDVIQLGKDKLGICVADVVGKGISAALLVANVQASVRALALDAASSSYVCSRINSVLCTNIAPGKFVTLFYGLLDAPSRTLEYTNAGHLLPILIDGSGNATHLANDGALLGVFPNWKYEDSTVELNPGDTLPLFTDGITEAIAPDGEEFGEDRLIAAATNSPTRSITDLQLELLEQEKNFSNGRMHDDATLIVISATRANSEEQKKALGGRNSSEQLMQHAGAQP